MNKESGRNIGRNLNAGRKIYGGLRGAGIGILGIILTAQLLCAVKASAEEPAAAAAGQVMTALRDTQAKEEPEQDAEVVHSFAKDDSVFVTGRTKTGWYQIFYQGREAYLPIEDLQEQAPDEELLKEMQTMQEYDREFIEEVERKRAALRSSRRWGIVIVVLIIVIFAVGIVSVLKNPDNKGKSDERKDKEIPEEPEVIDLDEEQGDKQED